MYIEDLSKELQEKAEKELNEVPGQTQRYLELIRRWFIKQPHLNGRTDDLLLLNFLRGCKFNLQKTKEKLDYFCTIRSRTPEVFENRDPFSTEIQDCLKRSIVLPLVPDTATYSPIIILRWKDLPHNFETVMKVWFMFFDIALKENNTYIITGLQIVNDFDGFSLNYMQHFTPSVCKKLFVTALKAYALRIKIIHVINARSYFGMFYNCAKPFLSKKLRNRVRIYNKNEIDKLYKHIPRSAMPHEYGGESGSISEITDKWQKKLESYREWFLNDSEYRCDETKRPGKSRQCVDTYEIEERLQKLEID